MSAPDDPGLPIDPLTVSQVLILTDRQVLYRCFAEDGSLLYIGTSAHLARRLAQHAEKSWFLATASITLEWYPNDLMAVDAETRAIEAEHPQYNIAHNYPYRVVVAPTLPPHPQGLVSIPQAIAAGFLPGYGSHGAVRTAKYRNPDSFPPVLQTSGPIFFYSPEALKEWALVTKSGQRTYRSRRRKRARRNSS